MKYFNLSFFIFVYISTLLIQSCSFANKNAKKPKRHLQIIDSLISQFDKPSNDLKSNNENKFSTIIPSNNSNTYHDDGKEQIKETTDDKEKILVWGLPASDGYGDVSILANIAKSMMLSKLANKFSFHVFCDTTHSENLKSKQINLLNNILGESLKDIIVESQLVQKSFYKYVILTPYHEPDKKLLEKIKCKKLLRIYEAGFYAPNIQKNLCYKSTSVSLGIGKGFSGMMFNESSQIDNSRIEKVLKTKSILLDKNIDKLFSYMKLYLSKSDQSYFVNSIKHIKEKFAKGEYFFAYAGGTLKKSVKAYYIQAILKYSFLKNGNTIPVSINDRNLIFVMPGNFQDRYEANDFATYIFGLKDTKLEKFLVSGVIVHHSFDIDTYKIIKYSSSDNDNLKNGIFIHIITGIFKNSDFNFFIKGSKYPFSLCTGDQSTADTLLYGYKIPVYDMCSHKHNFINNLWVEFRSKFTNDEFCKYESLLKIDINSNIRPLFPYGNCLFNNQYVLHRKFFDMKSNDLAVVLLSLENPKFVKKYQDYLKNCLGRKYNFKNKLTSIIENTFK